MRRPDGRWVVPAEVGVSGHAAHLGAFEACPVAMLSQHEPWVSRTLETYRAQRRLGLCPVPPTALVVQSLLVVDEELERLAEAERRRAEQERGPK